MDRKILQHRHNDENSSNNSDNDLIREFLTIFMKGIKTSALYPSDNPIPLEFKQTCWIKLRDYLDEFTQLSVEVYPDSFKDRQFVILKAPGEDENLAGIFHSAGIRQLRFNNKLCQDEWDEFFDDVLDSLVSEDSQVDLVNLLWQRDFMNIDYEVIVQDQTADSKTGLWIGTTRKRINYSHILQMESAIESVNLIDILNSEKQAMPETISNEIKKYHPAFRNLQEFLPGEHEYLKNLTSNDESSQIEFKAIDLIFEIMMAEKELSNFDKSIDTISSRMDMMFEEEQFVLLAYFLRKMKECLAILEKENSPIRFEKFKDCYTRTGDRIRISKISNILNRSEKPELDDIQMYLEELDWESLTSLIWMLGELEYFPARQMLIKALVNKCRDRIDIIGNAVYDSRWYVVRNAILILGEVRDERGFSYFRKTIGHFDERVRWEVIVAIEKISTQSGFQLLLSRLDDESSRIRRKALSILTANCYQPAFLLIEKLVNSGNLSDLEYDEQKDWMNALGTVGGEEAVPILSKIARKKLLFSSDKNMKQKELAIIALMKIDSESARQSVNEISHKKGSLGNFTKLLLENHLAEDCQKERADNV
jgi:HEAT repeat protein